MSKNFKVETYCWYLIVGCNMVGVVSPGCESAGGLFEPSGYVIWLSYLTGTCLQMFVA